MELESPAANGAEKTAKVQGTDHQLYTAPVPTLQLFLGFR